MIYDCEILIIFVIYGKWNFDVCDFWLVIFWIVKCVKEFFIWFLIKDFYFLIYFVRNLWIKNIVMCDDVVSIILLY